MSQYCCIGVNKNRTPRDLGLIPGCYRPGRDSSTAKLWATGVSVTGPQRWPHKQKYHATVLCSYSLWAGKSLYHVTPVVTLGLSFISISLYELSQFSWLLQQAILLKTFSNYPDPYRIHILNVHILLDDIHISHGYEGDIPEYKSLGDTKALAHYFIWCQAPGISCHRGADNLV